MKSSQRDYYEFMGYDSDIIRERYRPYAERFAPGARVADIGCGRGEFLQLLRERGVDPVGVDADPDMVAAARAQGIAAERAGATEFLAAHRGEFDGVYAAHLVEHMPGEAAGALIAAAAGALRPGGRLLMVTPNPRNLQMHLRDFWVDSTHVRFYTPETLRYLMHEAGLGDLEDGENALYRTQLAVPDLAEPVFSDPPPLPPHPSHAAMGPAARRRQAMAEWLEAASTLERVQDVEHHVASVIPPQIAELREQLRAAHSEVLRLRQWIVDLFPPGEFWVSGTLGPSGVG